MSFYSSLRTGSGTKAYSAGPSVLRVLAETATALAQDPAWGPQLLETPRVLGPISQDDRTVGVRATVKTKPGQHVEVTRALRKRVLGIA